MHVIGVVDIIYSEPVPTELYKKTLTRMIKAEDGLSQYIELIELSELSELEADRGKEIKDLTQVVARQHEQLSDMLKESDDLCLQIKDARLRNKVLARRLERSISVLGEEACPPQARYGPCPNPQIDCADCWRVWLEQEVQA